MTIIIFLLVLSVLVFVHELGHFITAKLSKMRVDEFAIGFPPRIYSKKIGETNYAINLIPFGGYVKIHGENPDDESMHGADNKRSFTSRPRYYQAIVLLSGVFFNIIFAWILLSAGLSFGMPVSTDFAPQEEFKNVRVVIDDVMVGSPAEIGGIKAGDEIHFLESKGDALVPSTIADFKKFVGNHGGDEVTIRFSRSSAEGVVSSSTTVVPKIMSTASTSIIGVSLSAVGDANISWYKAPYHGLRLTYYSLIDISTGLFAFIKNIFIGKANFSHVTGPVGIAKLVGEARSLGWSYLISFVAFISLNLAVINLLPLPALDGGRILFVLIESITRRQIPPKFANTVNLIGLACLLTLMVVITYNDIVKLIFH